MIQAHACSNIDHRDYKKSCFCKTLIKMNDLKTILYFSILINVSNVFLRWSCYITVHSISHNCRKLWKTCFYIHVQYMYHYKRCFLTQNNYLFNWFQSHPSSSPNSTSSLSSQMSSNIGSRTPEKTLIVRSRDDPERSTPSSLPGVPAALVMNDSTPGSSPSGSHTIHSRLVPGAVFTSEG